MSATLIVDILVIFTILEAAGLLLWRRFKGTGPKLKTLLTMLAPGLFVMLAMRALAYEQSWLWIITWTNFALIAHLIDLRRRWHEP